MPVQRDRTDDPQADRGALTLAVALAKTLAKVSWDLDITTARIVGLAEALDRANSTLGDLLAGIRLLDELPAVELHLVERTASLKVSPA